MLDTGFEVDTHNERIQLDMGKKQEQVIYADYNGSAPLDNEVADYLVERIKNGCFCNPNASHSRGLKAFMDLEQARNRCSKVLGCKPKNIIFNSGSTEGVSTIFHTLVGGQPEKSFFILSGIEHSALYNNAKIYTDQGKECKILPTLKNGIVDLETLDKWLGESAIQCSMVSIMAANNETGIIQPYKEIAQICQKHSVPYFSDTTQFICKADFNFLDSGIDFAITSGHKFGAMTGTGIILAKDVQSLRPLIIGGGQEKSLRGGTQHYLGIETLPLAMESFIRYQDKIEPLAKKRIAFEKEIKKRFPKVVIIGETSPRLATTTYISYPGLCSKEIQRQLQRRNILVTTSSACSDAKSTISRVLNSMGVTEEVGKSVIRISLGLSSPLDYYDTILEKLTESYKALLNSEIQ